MRKVLMLLDQRQCSLMLVSGKHKTLHRNINYLSFFFYFKPYNFLFTYFKSWDDYLLVLWSNNLKVIYYLSAGSNRFILLCILISWYRVERTLTWEQIINGVILSRLSNKFHRINHEFWSLNGKIKQYIFWADQSKNVSRWFVQGNFLIASMCLLLECFKHCMALVLIIAVSRLLIEYLRWFSSYTKSKMA